VSSSGHITDWWLNTGDYKRRNLPQLPTCERRLPLSLSHEKTYTGHMGEDENNQNGREIGEEGNAI